IRSDQITQALCDRNVHARLRVHRGLRGEGLARNCANLLNPPCRRRRWAPTPSSRARRKILSDPRDRAPAEADPQGPTSELPLRRRRQNDRRSNMPAELNRAEHAGFLSGAPWPNEFFGVLGLPRKPRQPAPGISNGTRFPYEFAVGRSMSLG